MAAWCMAHPWMTFFVCLAIADSVRICVSWPRRSKPYRQADLDRYAAAVNRLATGHSAGCPSFHALPKPCTCKAGE